MAESKIVKQSRDGRWLIAKIEDKYFFIDTAPKESAPLRTPNGILVDTTYYQLAERILDDLSAYGTEHMTAESVLPWHFTMVENFSLMKHEQIEAILDECFMRKHDWTYEVDHDEIFGDEDERIAAIRKWLSKCTHMQMTAACCIGNAYHSINVAYVLAALMEKYTGRALRKQFKTLAEIVEEHAIFDDLDSIMSVFDTFNLYYGIQNEKEDAIINAKLSIVEEDDGSSDIEVTEELLIGRNFYHYTDGERDEEQPFILETDLSYLESSNDEDDDDDYDEDYDEDDEDEGEDEDEYDDDDEDEDEDEDEYDEEYDEYLPRDCWIKRISTFEDDEAIYYHVILEAEDGVVTNVSVLRDEISHISGGMFFIPGMTMPENHYYEEVDADDYPEEINNELESLKKKRYLPNKFSFMGKKLPQEILDRGGNGGDMTVHICAIQSAYRLAYTDISVSTTKEGIIEDFDYSSYQSTGSAYGDMFSRPHIINDKHEEIIDMLLYILDLYTDEEIKEIM